MKALIFFLKFLKILRKRSLKNKIKITKKKRPKLKKVKKKKFKKSKKILTKNKIYDL